jgi:peptidoglycan/xylan/chitin deacetylase (PgdA/CDA1 family)
MDNSLYPYSPISDRRPLHWPDGKRVAFYVGLNVEYYRVDAPSTSIFPGTAGLVPDPLNYGWRDYGPRVGIWRMLDAFDATGIRASVLLNSAVITHNPQIIEAGVARDWAWLAHGVDNSTYQTDMAVDVERAQLEGVVRDIESATGRRPRGWLGPALTETFHTPQLLADLGLDYVLDWTCDDQPFPLLVERARPFLSVPYSIEVNDISLFLGTGMSGPDFALIYTAQLDQLNAYTATSGRVMALCLHPFVSGQAFRYKYLLAALRYIAAKPEVWLTTSDDIADWYLREHLTGTDRS